MHFFSASTPAPARARPRPCRSDPPADLSSAPQPQLDEPSIRAALDASLRRLQTHYVDLYQIHWWGKQRAGGGNR